MREFSRSLPMSLLRAREAVMRQFRPSLRNHGLTEQQWRILRALTAVEAIEVTELARMAFLLGPSLSRILRDLEARQLVERKTAEVDQRRAVVSISATVPVPSLSPAFSNSPRPESRCSRQAIRPVSVPMVPATSSSSGSGSWCSGRGSGPRVGGGRSFGRAGGAGLNERTANGRAATTGW